MKLPFFNESLNAFLAVAAERSFSAAAKKLGVTQSAVTKAVARLEKELEVELFDRGCRPVMLTEEAMLLLKDVLACQHTLENTAEFMQSRSNLKPVYRIGVIEGLSKSLMPQLIKALQSEASEIVTQIGTSLVLVEKLVRNELDFAFTSAAYDEVRGLYRTKLFEEESIVLMPKAMAPSEIRGRGPSCSFAAFLFFILRAKAAWAESTMPISVFRTSRRPIASRSTRRAS